MNPEGDGGYNQTGGASGCPVKNSPNWDVDADALLPAIPEPALQYMKDGAGDGPGLKGGSMNAGTQSSGTADPDSAKVDGAQTGGATSDSAAVNLRAPEIGLAPMMCALVVALGTTFGASLIMI